MGVGLGFRVLGFGRFEFKSSFPFRVPSVSGCDLRGDVSEDFHVCLSS